MTAADLIARVQPAHRVRGVMRMSWWVMTALAFAIGGYALTLSDGRVARGTVFGQLWIDHLHFVAGGVALIVGPWSFRRDLLRRWASLHRKLGWLYVVAAASSGLCGLAMAVPSIGGMPAHLGFGGLAVGWLYTTGALVVAIRAGDVVRHRRWAVRSYALCYAAVTLRVQLVPLVVGFGPETAFSIVSWSCWVPNLVFAEWWLGRTTVAGEWSRRLGVMV